MLKRRFLAFPSGPGGLRELPGAGRNHFHLSWYLVVPGITSYGQNPGGSFITLYGMLCFIAVCSCSTVVYSCLF